MRLYHVSRGDDSSPWELTAKSPEAAIQEIKRFYPETIDLDLVAVEVTIMGLPIRKLNQVPYGTQFMRTVMVGDGRHVSIGKIYVKGDFDHSRDQYRCMSLDGKYEFLNPYQTIITM